MIEPYKGKIYDPACGSGGMFLQSAKFVDAHNGSKKDISVYGQEYTATTYKLAKMNLAIRGISANLGSVAADTFLDTIYIDKPIQEHNLIQIISRVNRKYKSKEKGLVVDYIGIKTAMNKALKQFSQIDSQNFEDINASIVIVKDRLDLLAKLFHRFDTSGYFKGTPREQLETLNDASEFVQLTKELESRFIYIVKRLKSAYDIACGSEIFTEDEKDHIHFYMAIRTIVLKLTKGDAPDTASMNVKVSLMIAEALKSDGIQEIFKLGSDDEAQIDIDDKAKYTDWNIREDIKAELKVDLIMLLAKHGYPPITKDEVFKEIFEQSENFKKYRTNF